MKSSPLVAVAKVFWVLVLAVGISLASAARAEEPDPFFDDDFDLELEEPASFPDPWEGFNRGVLNINQSINTYLLNPISNAYAFVLPEAVRVPIRRAFRNLNSAQVLVNDLLQLEWKDAGVTFTSFAVNTTVGIVGLFDPAAAIGLERHESDFGQTLALAGIPSGNYLLLPVFGPSCVRDSMGSVVDAFFDPLTYVFAPRSMLGGNALYVRLTGGISSFDEAREGLEALEESSIDFYAALHSAFYQTRQAAIWERREHRRVEEGDAAWRSGGAFDGLRFSDVEIWTPARREGAGFEGRGSSSREAEVSPG